jgi:DNA-binding winged helix-turn-helix (wHTH) protein
MTSVKTTFGPFAFDPATGELWREGRRVGLQRQPSRLLQLLTARHGDAV